MAKSDVIALLAEGGVLRGVRFAPRGRDSWTRTGGGAWPLQTPDSAMAPDGGDGTEAATPSPAVDETVVESDKPLTRALMTARAALGSRDIVLALPLSQVLVRVLKMPLEVRDDVADAVALQMDKLSPFPGEELAVGCEILSETESHLWVFAAALPAAVFEELGAALDEARLQAVRTDVAVLGWLRSLSGLCQLMRPGRRVLLMDPGGSWELAVLDHGVPVLVRGLGGSASTDDVIRELTLSLLNVELDAGGGAVAEVIVVSQQVPERTLVEKLSELTAAEVRHVAPPTPDGGVEGVALRTGEGAALDLTPQAWRDKIKEARIRKRVVTGVGMAMAIWVVLMGTLFAGPAVYKQLTAQVRKQSRAHAKAYRQVADTRERVNLIESYTDRTRSSLEMLRMVSSVLPQGITLVGFTYRRDEGVKISGEADQPTLVYDFKNAVNENPLFEAVTLVGPSISRGKHKFDVDATFKGRPEKK
ncbi:MAG TPA: hypothetical protein P5026_14480 [Kiritimatiellia bacterium]|nr:hypothetical protein [Kiritimatiellia bacterium]HRR35303.1 hypothetical protein [Kiritimatiellia bacterium]HRU71788.1 hypothetical protein [Kiritimatiellia bacterium]